MDLTKNVSKSYVLNAQANSTPYPYVLCNPERSIINISNLKLREQTGLASTNNPVHLNPTIHINPNVFIPRNIRVNEAVCSLEEKNSSTSKTERIYYNPKFLQKRTSEENESVFPVIHKNKENKIHLNPHFIKRNQHNGNVASLSNLESEGSCIIKENEKPNTKGIHFNPKFLKSDVSNDNISKAVSSSSLFSNCETNISKHVSKIKPRIKHISKYKLIRSKVSPSVFPVVKDFRDLSYSLKKTNTSYILKKTNTIIKKKSTQPYSLLRNNKFTYLSKYSMKKCVPGATPKGPMEKITFDKCTSASRNLRNTNASFIAGYLKARKSILQSQIEARRKGRRYSTYTRSKYKYIKNNQETSPKKDPAPSSYRKHHYFKSQASSNLSEVFPKSPFSSVYKSINRTKLVMKSILQRQIESRRLVKNSNFYFQRLFYKKFHQDLISKYKLIRSAKTFRKSELPDTTGSNMLPKRGQTPKKNDEDIRKRSNAIHSKYRIVKKKQLTMLTKKMKKNNQPCPFYGRFGRCKGKDKGTCPKLHDPKYIAICKKHLKGECKDGKCLLSHDIRPEKMPTCHHYLSGLCKRADCPYLHIKVNQKAPICRSFLHGFCEDVFNCRKRHEYICPLFAEKGNCPRGKWCFPHRSSTTRSKLLGPDQFPLLERRGSRQKRVDDTPPDKVRELENIDPLPSTGDKPPTDTNQSEPSPKPFSRYFLQPLSSQDTLKDHNIKHNSDTTK